MAGTQDLSFAFLESHPVDAAKVLERIAPQNVAMLLTEMPMRLAAPVLRAMLPLHVARCLESLTDDMVPGLLRAMGPQSGVAVLHYVPESRRNVLLGQLPTVIAMAFRLLLGYPEDTVGAWMNPRVLALPGDTTAEMAIRRLRETDEESDSNLFVIGSDQRLLGRVAAAGDGRPYPEYRGLFVARAAAKQDRFAPAGRDKQQLAATALRLLMAHRAEVSKERALQEQEDEAAILASLTNKLNLMREREAGTRQLLITAGKHPPEDHDQ